jgi:hypothetical protein
MTTIKRQVEVFTAGCPICDETVNLVKSVACPSCDVRIYDLREGCSTNECREKARQYGITVVPAIAVNGVLLDCCRRKPITASLLRTAGIGQAWAEANAMDEQKKQQGEPRLVWTGLIGSVIVALCCFTPLLVVLLGR